MGRPTTANRRASKEQPQQAQPSAPAKAARTRTAQSAVAPAAEPARPSRLTDVKRRATFHISIELMDRVKDAVVALSGPPTRLTLTAFVEEAFTRELERLRKELHRGRQFPKREGEVRNGRPVGS